MVDQLADLFRTTHKVKTQQVVKIHGQYCGDIELPGYLVNEVDPVRDKERSPSSSSSSDKGSSTVISRSQHASFIELQTVLKLKVGVCKHETLDKV
jgi:hypothetical protein